MKPARPRRRLDLASLGAACLGVGLILYGQILEGGTIRALLQPAAAVIVLGGTLGAVCLSFPSEEVWRAVGALWDVLLARNVSTDDTITTVVRYALRARRDGVIALEHELERETDPFLRRCLQYATDGVTTPAVMREVLERESLNREEQDEEPARVFEAAGGYAPTIGILGAVLGLIQVMRHLSDPSQMGSGIAVAFVATLYGVASANLFLLPLATRMRARARQRFLRRALIIEGIVCLAEGANPRWIAQNLYGLALDTGGPSRSQRAA